MRLARVVMLCSLTAVTIVLNRLHAYTGWRSDRPVEHIMPEMRDDDARIPNGERDWGGILPLDRRCPAGSRANQRFGHHLAKHIASRFGEASKDVALFCSMGAARVKGLARSFRLDRCPVFAKSASAAFADRAFYGNTRGAMITIDPKMKGPKHATLRLLKGANRKVPTSGEVRQ